MPWACPMAACAASGGSLRGRCGLRHIAKCGHDCGKCCDSSVRGVCDRGVTNTIKIRARIFTESHQLLYIIKS